MALQDQVSEWSSEDTMFSSFDVLTTQKQLITALSDQSQTCFDVEYW